MPSLPRAPGAGKQNRYHSNGETPHTHAHMHTPTRTHTHALTFTRRRIPRPSFDQRDTPVNTRPSIRHLTKTARNHDHAVPNKRPTPKNTTCQRQRPITRLLGPPAPQLCDKTRLAQLCNETRLAQLCNEICGLKIGPFFFIT